MSDSLAAPIRELASGIGFTEGPVWTQRGTLIVVSMSRGLIYEVDPGGAGAHAAAEPGGGPNGLAEDANEVLWIAQNGARHRPSSSGREAAPGIQSCVNGVVTEAASGLFVAPNDCAVGHDSRVWITDPDGPAFESSDAPGRVWAFDPVSSATEMMIEGLAFPNGLAFRGKELYVAETRRRRILRFRVDEGAVSDPEEFVALDNASPDGLAFDAAGSLYIAAPDADCVVVVDVDGEVAEKIDLGSGSFPTNLCFGGDDFCTLYVTAVGGGRVLAIERSVPGMPPLP